MTEGGEALSVIENVAVESSVDQRQWHVLWTRSNCEQLVHDQLAARGFQAFLPTVEAWSRRSGARRLETLPMFPGYLFLHHHMDKGSYLDVCRATGLVRVLGDSWDRLAIIPEDEIGGIQRIVRARVAARPHPYLREGQRVRITSGPLQDTEGLLLRSKPSKGFLIVSVHMLRRSVAVEVDCTAVAPA